MIQPTQKYLKETSKNSGKQANKRRVVKINLEKETEGHILRWSGLHGKSLR